MKGKYGAEPSWGNKPMPPLKNEDIPELWGRFLSVLQEAGTAAVIGGGALRDLENSRPIKDVDVFVPSYAGSETIYSRLAAWFGLCNVRQNLPEYVAWKKMTGDLGGLFSVEFDGTTFEVIGVKESVVVTAENIAVRNDLGICQIAWDGVNLYRSPKYLLNQAHKYFSVEVCIDEAALERTVNRWHRLSKKYEWPLICPFEYAEFATEELLERTGGKRTENGGIVWTYCV